MERFKIINKNKEKEYFSIKLHDTKENFDFWIDCSIIDGYGNKENYKTEDLFIDWEFNQYIFDLYNENDLKAKAYQENGENIDEIQFFIDDKNDDLLRYFLESGEK